jgi:hypothetical protein
LLLQKKQQPRTETTSLRCAWCDLDQGEIMSSDFEAVANGTQRRARWRSPLGWVRVERLSDHHLQVRGPRAEVKSLARAIRSEWISLMHGTSAMALDSAAGSDEVELLLVRSTSPLGTRRPSKRPPPSLRPAPGRPTSIMA